LIGRGCVLALGYVVTFILTRKLGPADYGVYGVVISQLYWLEMLANAGVPGAISKFMVDGNHDQRDVERSAQALSAGFSLLLFGIGWFVAPWVADLMQIPNGAVLLRIAIIDMPFAALVFCYDGILNGRRQFGVLAGVYAAQGLIRLIGVIALLRLGLSIERALIVTVISTCAITLWLVFRYHPRGFRPKGRIIKEIAVMTTPQTVYLVTVPLFMNLDLWSLQAWWKGGRDVIGHYVASMNLAKVLMVIPAAQAGILFVSVALAVAAGDPGRARRHIQDATRFALIISAAAWVILSSDAAEILGILYSRPYSEGRYFLPYQIAGFALFALFDAFVHALQAAGRFWSVAGALVAAVPFVWLSNYVLIPWLGPVGAAISMVLGLSLGTGIVGVMSHRLFGSLVQPLTLLRIFVAGAVTWVVSNLVEVQGVLLLVKFALLGLLYLGVLFLMREITVKDFNLVRKIGSETPIR
jgi:O-antigen/teichoic acid export membrane protein